jgi:hypothetical protein
MLEKGGNFIPRESFENEICQIWGGSHKTSRHEGIKFETKVEKEKVLPICDNCGGNHDTSRCPLLENKPVDKFPNKG